VNVLSREAFLQWQSEQPDAGEEFWNADEGTGTQGGYVPVRTRAILKLKHSCRALTSIDCCFQHSTTTVQRDECSTLSPDLPWSFRHRLSSSINGGGSGRDSDDGVSERDRTFYTQRLYSTSHHAFHDVPGPQGRLQVTLQPVHT
jgi:hypothetical protein